MLIIKRSFKVRTYIEFPLLFLLAINFAIVFLLPDLTTMVVLVTKTFIVNNEVIIEPVLFSLFVVISANFFKNPIDFLDLQSIVKTKPLLETYFILVCPFDIA